MIDELVNTPIHTIDRRLFDDAYEKLRKGVRTTCIIGNHPYTLGSVFFIGYRSGARFSKPLYTGVYVRVTKVDNDVVTVELEHLHRIEGGSPA